MSSEEREAAVFMRALCSFVPLTFVETVEVSGWSAGFRKRKRLFNKNRSKTLLFHYNFSGGTLNSNAGNFEKVNSWSEEESRLRSDHQTTSNIITSMSTCQQHTLAGKHTQKVPDSIMKRRKDMIPTFLENLYTLLEKERGLLLLVWSFSPFLF